MFFLAFKVKTKLSISEILAKNSWLVNHPFIEPKLCATGDELINFLWGYNLSMLENRPSCKKKIAALIFSFLCW